jgi:drug/metabolite transporter (DMT)-like permease
MSGPALLLAGLAATGSPVLGSALLASLTISSGLAGPVLGAMLDRSPAPGRRLAAALLLYAAGLALVAVLVGGAPAPLVVGVAILAIALRFRLGFRRDTVGRATAAGAIVALTLVLQFAGTSLTGGAEGALLTTTTPAFVLLLGATVERERVRPAAWAGVAVALAGVAAIAAG